jgi:hypothetical protein
MIHSTVAFVVNAISDKIVSGMQTVLWSYIASPGRTVG